MYCLFPGKSLFKMYDVVSQGAPALFARAACLVIHRFGVVYLIGETQSISTPTVYLHCKQKAWQLRRGIVVGWSLPAELW
jgi:hypothetical protein